MFAGPNGSGKSSIIEQVKKLVNFGYYINADELQYELNNRGYIACDQLIPFSPTQDDWKEFTKNLGNDIRVKSDSINQVYFDNGIIKAHTNIDGYVASILSEFLRIMLLEGGYSFSFETVMSHPSKIEFIQQAASLGYKTYLYFICTNDPLINRKRVENRVIHGGHDVSEEKITSRYFKSLDLLEAAFLNSTRAFIIDNSGPEGNIIVEKNKDDIFILEEEVPVWVYQYLIDKINK